MAHKLILSALGSSAIALAAALAAVPAVAQDIGVVASIEPTMRGTAPGARPRNLAQGDAVVANETIETGAEGRGQVLFLDQTTLALAPSSRVVLDSFVFDPDGGGGSFGLQLTQGALRFIGGRTTENRDGTITTPTATIGIRGSSGLVLFENGATIAVFLMGDRMCTDAVSPPACTSREGGVLTDEGYAGQVSADFLAVLLELIDGLPPDLLGPGGAGGTGVDDGAPPDSGQISSRGEEEDGGDPDQQFITQFGLGLFQEVPMEEDEGGGEEEPPDECEIYYSESYDLPPECTF